MKGQKRLRFPILLKVILLGVITSFAASTVAIVVNYNNMINKEIRELDEAATGSLEFANTYFDDPDSSSDSQFLTSFAEIKKYVLNIYNILPDNPTAGDSRAKVAKVEDYNTFSGYKDEKTEQYINGYEDEFIRSFPYYYPEGMSMSLDYQPFKQNLDNIYNVLLNISFYSDQNAFYAVKDPANPDRFIFLVDNRISTFARKNVYYHCPGSHYDVKDTDNIFDIGHSYVKGYKLDKYTTRFVEINAKNDDDVLETIGYVFVEYDTASVVSSFKPTIINEILILTATSLVVIALYAVLSYLMFVRNIDKLNKFAINISNNLENKEQFEVVDLKIGSRDEIKTLGDSFVAMENQLVNYIDIIKNDAREKEKINAELEIASKIQLEALQSANFDDENVSIRSYIKAAKEVGGDFYDYFYIDENRLAVIISDVSGKGIPASLFMMKSKELMRSKLLLGDSLATAISEVNNTLSSNNEESLFVTSFIGVIDFEKEEIRYIDAGHEKPYIISKGKIIKLDEQSNFVLGGVSDFDYKEGKHEFHKGDMIFMFTDGLNESINESEEEFSYKRIEEVLEKTKDSSLEEHITIMKDELENFTKGQESFDDVTMVIVRFNDNKLTLSYDKKDPSIIEDAVSKFESKFAFVDSDRKSKVGIILDELLNNLISYEEREDLQIEVKFSFRNDVLGIEIVANGHDYDPFSNNKEKYLEEFSHEVEEGGFGVTLVKTFAKKTSYSYKNNKSHTKIEL